MSVSGSWHKIRALVPTLHYILKCPMWWKMSFLMWLSLLGFIYQELREQLMRWDGGVSDRLGKGII